MYGFVGEFQAVGLAVGLFSWGAELRGLHREQVRAPPLIPCGSELARDDSGTSAINAKLIHRYREQARSHIGEG